MALSSATMEHVRVVGRYALHDNIASGGMATVHIGRLIGPVGFSRMVAIKRLHPQYAREPEFVSMFLDEARVAARIRHPNVVGTLDVVALEGELFLVMEYVQGESLAALMRTVRERATSVPIPIAVAIVVDVLEGLHAAHEAVSDQGEPLGIVHRDVSPQNILVGIDGVARVVDFGVAKAAGRVQSTRDGQLKGKLGYMAPEQISGQATRATDVHAAAVVLWEMLTGQRLYHAENDLQTFSNILSGAGVVAPSQFAPEVSPALNRVVMQGLQANPSARFPSAREMARSLQRAAPLASPSDVGDWVQGMARESLELRARKISAIESASAIPVVFPSPVSGTVPTAASLSGPAPGDSGRTSHPPVSGERRRSLRVPGARFWIIPLAVTTLAAGTALGLFLRGSPPRAAALARDRVTAASTAAAGAARPASPSSPWASAPATRNAAASGWSAIPPPAASPGLAASASASPFAPATAARVADDGRVARPGRLPLSDSAPRPPMAAPAQVPLRPSTVPGGSDFSHVMDTRK